MQYIGGIVENPDMYGYMSAVDNLKLFAKIRGINKSEVDRVLKLVGLEDAKKQKVSKYSLGMKQRAGLALALLHSPKILILDEPTNGLDPAGIKDLRYILKKLSRENKTAVLVSSHILTEMELMCDKVAVIDKGKIVKIEELNKQTVKVKKQCVFKVVETEKALEVIKTNISDDVYEKDERIYINSSVDISEIIKKLVENNINIKYANENEHNLEDIFFDATRKEESKW